MAEQMSQRVRQIEADMRSVKAEREAKGTPDDANDEEQRKNRIRFKRGIKAIELHIEAFKEEKRARYGPDRDDGAGGSGAGGGGCGGAGAALSA